MSEYLIWSAAFALYKEDMLNLKVPLAPIDTTLIGYATMGSLWSYGWDRGQPCEVIIYSPEDTSKVFNLTEKEGLLFNLTFANDLKC